MGVNTRIHDRRKRQERDRERIAEGEAKARKSMMERALKSRIPTLDFDGTSPAQQLSALENYVLDLRDLQEDLRERFSDIPQFRRSTSWLEFEISLALEEIVRLSIEETKPAKYRG